MWKIYVLLALWMQSLYVVHMLNSRSAGMQNTETHSELPDLMYNTNSRNSNGDTSHQVTYTANDNQFTTKSYEYDGIIRNDLPTAENLNAKLFQILSLNAQHENFVYSPISLQTLLSFIFTISSGKLYEELAQLLAISNSNTNVANTFKNILQTPYLNTPPTTLILANKLYYDSSFSLSDQTIHNIAKQNFGSELEQIDFSSTKNAASIINSWVQEKTHNLIKDIVTPSSFSKDTNALLLNSIYFKSEWEQKFATYDTETQNFFITQQLQVPVDMMYNEDAFRYGDFSNDLQASVVELPYDKSNLTMMLILPNRIDGLADMERRLRYYDLESVSQKLKRATVVVKLPRFNVEFETDMIKPLQEMGLTALFNNVGSINLFTNRQKPFAVDQFKHKCFIKVNEAGTEAAAATVAKYVPLSVPHNLKNFVADHPFVFVIRDPHTTFFIGHVVKF